MFDLFQDEPKLTPDRVLRLIRNLPDGALTFAMYHGPEYVGWDRTTSMLADLYDAVVDNTYVAVLANAGDKKAKSQVKEPDRYPRPGSEKQKPAKQNAFAAQAKKLLTAQRSQEDR